MRRPLFADRTGLEPATSAVTGRRANQLRYGARNTALWRLLSRNTALCNRGMLTHSGLRTPNGIRTRATAVKGRRPRPLDDGG